MKKKTKQCYIENLKINRIKENQQQLIFFLKHTFTKSEKSLTISQGSRAQLKITLITMMVTSNETFSFFLNHVNS